MPPRGSKSTLWKLEPEEREKFYSWLAERAKALAVEGDDAQSVSVRLAIEAAGVLPAGITTTPDAIRNYLWRTRSPETPAENPEHSLVHDRAYRDLKQRYQELKHRYDISLDDQAYFQRVYDMFRAEVRALPPPPPISGVPPIDPKHATQDAVAFISCIHLGEMISEAATHGLGHYDVATAQARFQDYIDSVIDLAINHHSGERFDTLWLVDVGDNISGTIHGELARTNEFYTTKQVAGAARLLACGIRDLAAYFNRVEFLGLPGNHPRMWPKPVHKEKADNFDTIVYHLVSEMVKGIPNVHVDAPESFFKIQEIRGHRFLFTHGDTISMWNQIPYYGVNRARMNLLDLVRRVDLDFEYFCVGNFHTNINTQVASGEVIMTGSSKGPDEYSISKLATGSDPVWQFFGVHPRWGVTFRYNVNLRAADPKKQTRYLHNVKGLAGSWEWPETVGL